MQVCYELQQHSKVEGNQWKWQQIIEHQVTLSANSCSTYKFKINKLYVSSCFVDNVILVLLNFLEYRFQRPTNEFASEIATGNLISMFKLN